MKQKQNLYVNAQKSTAMIHAVEFARAGDEELTFYKISSLSSAEEAKKWLKDTGLAEEFLGQTELNNDTTLVVRTPLNSQAQLAALKSEGVNLHHPTPEEKRVSLWGLRGGLSMVGQVLQLASSKAQSKGLDTGTLGFAGANILANLSNIFFGSQKTTDVHQLNYLKNNINQTLGDDFNTGSLPEIASDRKKLRPQPHLTSGQRAYNSIQKYSVSVGEVGLRMFGAMNLIFPFERYGTAFDTLKKEGFGSAIKNAYGGTGGVINTKKGEPFDAKKENAVIGILYMIGKSLALFAKIPDPYNPKPASTLDKIREKYLFQASSIIELFAAGGLAINRLRKGKINLEKLGGPNKEIRDYLGGIGGLLFTVGLFIRIFAPFGEREVDMGELKAHVSDAIAQVPQEKRSEAMVKIVGDLVDHFGEKKVSFGQLYADIAADLQKQHNITLPSLPDTQKKSAPAIAKAEEKAPAPVVAKEDKGFANDGLRKSADRPAPAASHRDRATTEPVNTVLGVA